jgi:Ca2+-binding EF-hand superfamily protein
VKMQSVIGWWVLLVSVLPLVVPGFSVAGERLFFSFKCCRKTRTIGVRRLRRVRRFTLTCRSESPSIQEIGWPERERIASVGTTLCSWVTQPSLERKRRMRRSTVLILGLLAAAVAILGTGCATDSGGREGGGTPPGRGRAGQRMARHEGGQPQELWKQYDLNGDGKITREEFMAVRAVCFARHDASGTGMLTRADVKRFSSPQTADRIDAEFSRLDLDGDGLVSREEFDRDSDRVFRQLDTNSDGVIAGTELSNMIPSVLGVLCSGPTDQRSGTPRGRQQGQ